MSDIEKLPKNIQLQARTTAVVMALKKTLISTPELQNVFNKHYEEEIKSYLDGL